MMKKKNSLIWVLAAAAMASGLTACGIDMPKETKTSFETITVEKGAQAVIALYIALGGGAK